MIIQSVGLPIGNIKDISSRAIEAIQSANIIICEDTRKLNHLKEALSLKVSAELFAVPAGREPEINWSEWIEQNKAKSVVLLSDAGTPLINDPGSIILQTARAQGVVVQAIPGVCAPVLAYQWSGGFGLPIMIGGFVPKKKIKEFFLSRVSCRTLVFFDTKYQYEKTFKVLNELGWGKQIIFVAREMTKTHEELLKTTVYECSEKLKKIQASHNGALGELTFVLEAPDSVKNNSIEMSIEDLLKIRFNTPKDASKVISEICGEKVKDIYQRIINWKK